MEITAPIVISSFALLISACSLFLSWRTSKRAIDAERVSGWIDLKRTQDRDWFLGTFTVRNPSPIAIKLERLTVGLPDFRLASLESVMVPDGMGSHVLPPKIEPKELAISMEIARECDAGDESAVQFLLYQPAHNRKKAANVTVRYWTREPAPQWRGVTAVARTRGDF